MTPTPAGSAARPWSPWRIVVAFGLVSLASDMVYEGMRAVAGPFLGSLGAFDRYGGRVLLVVPLVVATVPPLVFAPTLSPVLIGVALWDVATGIQDSTCAWREPRHRL